MENLEEFEMYTHTHCQQNRVKEARKKKNKCSKVEIQSM